MTVHLVSHFHWDREWYRPWQAFRARLVDAVDRVLDLAANDPGYRFLLDGQTVVLEDYLEIRPERESELRELVAAGRLGIGPWYVQPDSLLPSGEAHVRNLLLGRRTGRRFGAASMVAYVPDSFGHPAQFPQLLTGFDLDGFVYWRGNGSEIDQLGPRWRWRAPDGSEIRALLLSEGYFDAARLDLDPHAAAERLAPVVARLRDAGEVPVVLMNGFDHTRPDPHVGQVAAALSERLGEPVVRSLLDEVVAAVPPAEDLPSHAGDLLGARLANLLPGVWSARMPLKLANRRCEMLLERWAEPFAALGRRLGLADERPALRSAWRSLVQNQAHDSICGCSVDATHERMGARFDDAERLATETTRRILGRLAGRSPGGDVEWTDELTIAVFNPSPRPRTDRVRVSLDVDPALAMSIGEPALHPLTLAQASGRGFTVDGRAVRVVEADDPARPWWIPDHPPLDVELVAEEVPPFGMRTYRLAPGDAAEEIRDGGRIIGTDRVRVEVEEAGTLRVDLGDRAWRGLFGLEDVGDRGDSYDHDPVGEPQDPRTVSVATERRRHPATGIEELRIRRVVEIPESLRGDREARSDRLVEVPVELTASVAPGVDRVDVAVAVDNRARDHRLRLRFPSGAPARAVRVATTFDAVTRTTSPTDDRDWVHPAPSTFCHQGWVEVDGLTVGAPGLPEAEVTSAGELLVTLVRAVGWLARFDVRTRPLPAGPVIEAPGAQVQGRVVARCSLSSGPGSHDAASDAEAGLWGVVGGPEPVAVAGRALCRLEPDAGELVLSAVKPAEHGDGVVVRVANTGDGERVAELRFGLPVGAVTSVRLDETPLEDLPVDDGTVRIAVPPHALRSVLVR